MGGGVQPASQIYYPSYDQNLRYSLPYLLPDQKFETLFMIWLVNQNPVSDQHYNKFPSSDQCKITVNIICEGLLLIFFSFWKTIPYLYIPYKGVPPVAPQGGVMHSNIFLFEVTKFTVVLCNPWLIIINWLTVPKLVKVSWWFYQFCELYTSQEA